MLRGPSRGPSRGPLRALQGVLLALLLRRRRRGLDAARIGTGHGRVDVEGAVAEAEAGDHGDEELALGKG